MCNRNAVSFVVVVVFSGLCPRAKKREGEDEKTVKLLVRFLGPTH